ncbi:MAG: lytic murein transglycosylase [Bdellovibrio sp.]|nr:lytic murein transglycosylase [Bdellovibrio sp.]
MQKKIMLTLLLCAGIVNAKTECKTTEAFPVWLQKFKAEAIQQGITPETLQKVSSYLTFDPEVIARDGKQGVFQKPFLIFSDNMATTARRDKAIKLITTTYKEIFENIEKDFGVPAAPIAAFWALESDFGAFTGKFKILSAVTTLAYDCRRADMFRRQAFSAIKLVQRGDIQPEEMIGNWAGELGGTQFMSADYLESGVDYDKDGKVNLVKSVPDTLASAGNFLMKKGWRRGEPWMHEVKVPEKMNWAEADLKIKYPVSKWLQWGVKPIGATLKDQNLMASLLLPMGRFGPAFLVYDNFRAFLGWNESVVYSSTAAFLAARITGAPPMQRGSDKLNVLNADQIKELQDQLVNQCYNVGEIDGKPGPLTKSAVKQMQIKLGLPADSYPSVELIEALKK